MKKFEILQELPKCDTDMKEVSAFGKKYHQLIVKWHCHKYSIYKKWNICQVKYSQVQ